MRLIQIVDYSQTAAILGPYKHVKPSKRDPS